MRSNYKKIGKYIRKVNIRNVDLATTTLLGINIDKFFMPSVANIVGTDMTAYKIVKKGQFSCNRMHVGRDYRLPVSLSTSEEDFLVSPAYDVFEVKNKEELLPEYLMMWFSRKEYDRNAWFYTDADVRGGLPWKSFCDMILPIPHIDKQREIVKEYNVIQNRIALNQQLIQNLEETAQAIYKQWFVDFEFPDENGKPYKSSGGEMVWCEELEKEVPKGWRIKSLSKLSKLITKGTTPQKMYTDFSPNLIPYVKIQAIGINHFVNPLKLEYIDLDDHMELRRSQILTDDILFSITGTLGEFAKATENIVPANTNQNIAIIRIDEVFISANYIYWLLICGWHFEFLFENRQEAVQANLNLTMIGNLKILLPKEYFLKQLSKKIDVLINAQFNFNKEIHLLTKINEIVLSKIATFN